MTTISRTAPLRLAALAAPVLLMSVWTPSTGHTTPAIDHSIGVAGPGLCVTPSALLVAYVQQVVSGSDSDMSIKQRPRFQLPNIPASQVTVVLDSAFCRRASLASGRARTVPDTTNLRPVSVLRVGATRYVVSDTTAAAGEFAIHITFDTTLSAPLAIWGI